MTEHAQPTVPADFPLFEGGPFAKVHEVLRLAGTERRHLWRSVALAVLVTWVPLAVLAALQGCAIGPDWHTSMITDVSMAARFLVALPLLILAPLGLRLELQAMVPHFLSAGLVREADRERFLANIRAILRWRDSRAATAVLVTLVIGVAVVFRSLTVEMPDSWRTLGTGGERRLSLAGMWLVAIGEPLYDLAMLQLAYRVALWWWFLWRTSRLDLRVDAAHPDGAGGLAFLARLLPAFRLPLFAVGASGAGSVANHMLLTGAKFVSFQSAIFVTVIVLVALTAVPLTFFNRKVAEAKRRAALAWGAVVGRQLRAYEEAWSALASTSAAELLQVPECPAYRDLSALTVAAQKANTLPFRMVQLAPLLVAALLPFLPAAAIDVPLKDILIQAWRLVK
ncbi:MAG: hypothetical protein LAO05_12525 [Acidobacteriia bacterium]|nr:hypothetical protein [Terriglobia bacterium]